MRVLFDNGVPKPIARHLRSHLVTYARQIGWHELSNGDLIQRAEKANFDVLLSTDKNIRYQQNLAGRMIAIVIIGNPKWPIVQSHLNAIAAAVNACKPGDYTEVEMPFTSGSDV